MSSAENVSASSGLALQYQIAATAKALDIQKQEGNAALQLIHSAVNIAQSAQAAQPQATGNNIDIIV